MEQGNISIYWDALLVAVEIRRSQEIRTNLTAIVAGRGSIRIDAERAYTPGDSAAVTIFFPDPWRLPVSNI